jgi:hypothetical protein
MMSKIRKNSINISGTLSNSPVIVNQNQDGKQSMANAHIEYEADDSTVRVFSQKSAKKKSGLFTLTAAMTILGFFADLFGVLSYFGIQKGMSIFALAPIVILVGWITKKDCWLVSLKDNGTAQFNDGIWYKKQSDGNFVSFTMKAKCIYPKCDGLVHIETAPPRERPNHSLVGICSVGGFRHTYTVDYNGVGYPREFDWRPLEQEKKT